MKRSTKIVVASLVTLGLVGVVAAKQFDGPGCGFGGGMPGGWVSEKIAWKLDLNDSQRAELDELRSTMFEGMKTMRAEKPGANDIQAVLGDTLDQEKALQMLDQRMQRVKDKAPEMITAFAGFYDSLDTAQQKELGTMIERRMERGGHHRGGPRGEGGYRGGQKMGSQSGSNEQ